MLAICHRDTNETIIITFFIFVHNDSGKYEISWVFEKIVEIFFINCV